MLEDADKGALAHRPFCAVLFPAVEHFNPTEQNFTDCLFDHAHAVRSLQDSYLDRNTKLSVITSVRLLARGACCGSGCRHCPYISRSSSCCSCQDGELTNLLLIAAGLS